MLEREGSSRPEPKQPGWPMGSDFDGRARRMDERHRPLPWPPTNMVLVAQRVASGQVLRLRRRRLDAAPPSYLRLSAWRDPAADSCRVAHQPEGETLDLVRRPTGAVELLDAAATVRDGHLLIAAYRLACAAGVA